MSLAQLCISTRANQLLRWQQAFPQGKILAETKLLHNYLFSPSLVWIHSDSLESSNLDEEISRITKHENCQQVVVISCVPNQHETMTSLAAGASGYCHALSTPELFQKIAKVVFNGGLWIGRDLLNQLAGSITHNLIKTEKPACEVMTRLSSRESEVARQVQKGASNKEISTTLNITERTVKAHLSSIFQKLEIRDRLQLILLLAD